ncbi:Cof-type HAD-IIB family hydrolase [Clostridium sp. SYSU_GA19001]|uniref:Cof-type HAD-IIB family hydrolase n=1 Tax=Clostridium caldaquaticum TaxID=2940653 RepID=UPI00207762D9|nr:Cof-type HAD-IIB family hydrolase [Clostridium caldaquaticum]MCM8711552.1 Cof-type HAD-IIB family hydrolase [Clostridium caldaquaticum]
MDYKLVCIDMDGTLLNKQHKVSEASKEALKKAHEKGVHIVISTGRMYVDAREYSDLIGVKSPVIASNGAIIKEKDKDEVIYQSILGEKLCLKLLDIFLKYNIRPTFSTIETMYSGNIFASAFMKYLKLRGIFNEKINFKHVWTRKQWQDIFKKEKDNIVKSEIMVRDENKIKKIREELKSIDGIEIASSFKHNVEITCRGVSKGSAVEILSNYYNIEREKIIAIGDSENDLSMIEFAGMGIAMGNAIDIVKQKADYITETNDNDGVAKAVKKFVLKQEY